MQRANFSPLKPTGRTGLSRGRRALLVGVGVSVALVIAASTFWPNGGSENSEVSSGVGSQPSAQVGRALSEKVPLEETSSGESVATSTVVNEPKAMAPVPRQSSLAVVHNDLLNPEKDGWITESFATTSQDSIQQLLDFTKPVESRAELGAKSFQGSLLRSDSLEVVYEDELVSVRRLREANQPDQPHHSLAEALQEFESGLQNAADRRVAVKTVSVHLEGHLRRTTHVLEASGFTAAGRLEQHATWDCEWTAENPLRLLSIVSRKYEESQCKLLNGPLLVDQTEEVFQGSDVFEKQLRFGLNHWLQRIESLHGMYVFAEYGLSLGDVNGDGYDDVYLCQPGGLPNRLLMRLAGGRLEDVTRQSNTGWLDHCSSSLLVDLDNDGDQDLVVALESRELVVMQNNGTGQFETAATLKLRDRHVQSLSAVDYDNDGQLDLYITLGFANAPDRDDPQPFVYHDANDGGRNVLFRNESRDAKWSFADVTSSVGLDVHNRRHSLAASWEDFDNDGDQDLYVANDYGQNCLYRNDGGRFVEIASQAGVVDFGSGMSVSWADFDHDGLVDLYVGNMFSAAGNRVSRQAAFQPQATPETRQILTRFAKGNTLFRNLGDGSFSDVEEAGGAELGRWAWSSVFCDLTNDGRDDLVVANGYITTDDNQDL